MSDWRPLPILANQISNRSSSSLPYLRVCPDILDQTFVGLEVELEYTRDGGREALNRAVRGSEPALDLDYGSLFDITARSRRARAEYPNLWNIHTDGSLRASDDVSAHELVLAEPIQLGQTELALQALSEWMSYGVDSVRHGVHVHVNAMPLNVWDLGVGLLTYAMFEPDIFERVGGGRRESIFCTPLEETVSSGRDIIRRLSHSVLLPASFEARMFSSWSRYTALNLHSLFTLGTVEFRHMPTPLEDPVTAIGDFAGMCASIFAPEQVLPSRFFKPADDPLGTPKVRRSEELARSKAEHRMVLNHMFDAALLRAHRYSRHSRQVGWRTQVYSSDYDIRPHLTTPWGREHAIENLALKHTTIRDGQELYLHPDEYWEQSRANRLQGYTNPAPGDECGASAYEHGDEDDYDRQVVELRADDFESGEGSYRVLPFRRAVDVARYEGTGTPSLGIQPHNSLVLTDEGIALASSLIPNV